MISRWARLTGHGDRPWKKRALRVSVSVICIGASGVPASAEAANSVPPVNAIAVVLPEEFESLRERLSSEVQNAVGSACAFFARHGFDVSADTVIDNAYVFATVASARSQCAARFGVPEEMIPATFSLIAHAGDSAFVSRLLDMFEEDED